MAEPLTIPQEGRSGGQRDRRNGDRPRTFATIQYKGGFLSETLDVKMMMVNGGDQSMMLETYEGQMHYHTRDDLAFKNIESVTISFED